MTASESLASNLEELLGLEGYSCGISKDILELKTSFREISPHVVILDELNNKGGYNELLKLVIISTIPNIIVLSIDSDKSEYPLASSCLGLPSSIDTIVEVLSNQYDSCHD